jgi:hypothetical protein
MIITYGNPLSDSDNSCTPPAGFGHEHAHVYLSSNWQRVQDELIPSTHL